MKAGKNFAPSFHIEGDGKAGTSRILFGGVLGVYEFSPEKILFFTRRETLSISGSALELTVFEGNNVEIFGRIEEICIRAKMRSEG